MKANKFTIDLKKQQLHESKELYKILKERFQKGEVNEEDEADALDALTSLRRDIRLLEYDLDEED